MAATISGKDVTILGILGTLLLFSVSVLLGGIGPLPLQASHLSQPLVEVWSKQYMSNNITDLSLTIGEFTVEVNVTETPTINAYEFFLHYSTSYLAVTKVIVKEGTFFGDTCVLCDNITTTPGVIRVSIGVIGANTKAGNGTLAFITFQVVGIGATTLDIRDDQLLLGATTIVHTTSDGLFRNSPNRPPVAMFTHSPTAPFQGNITTFDASGSTDPDGDETIVSYFWRWGDDTGTSTTDNPVITHVFLDRNGDLAYGDFTVTLRVTDDTGLTDTASALITVRRVPLHDVGIGSLAANFLTANPGQTVTLSVSVTNRGTFAETTQLRVYAGSTLIDTRPGISLSPGQSQPFEIEWDTTGVAPDVYRITANVTAVPDETSTDNNSASTFVSIVASATGFSASLMVGSAVGATALVALAIFLLRRRRKTPAEN